MKASKRFGVAIAYFLLFLAAVVGSGVALYFQEHGIGLPMRKSLEGFLEILVPHLAAMGIGAFVVAHFLLFISLYSDRAKRILYGVLLGLILLDQGIYLWMWSGWATIGWIKPPAVVALSAVWAAVVWAVAVAL